MTLVQEAMSIMEAMPRRNQQIVLELLRAMSSQPTFREKPEKVRIKIESRRDGTGWTMEGS